MSDTMELVEINIMIAALDARLSAIECDVRALTSHVSVNSETVDRLSAKLERDKIDFSNRVRGAVKDARARGAL